MLLKHFTAPRKLRTVASYADELDSELAARRPRAVPTDALRPPLAAREIAREPARVEQMRSLLGVYADPWFGEIRVCEQSGEVRFQSRKSPLLAGQVMRVGNHYLVDWDRDSVDVEAWLNFVGGNKKNPWRLTMSKLNPAADFSFDFEDLAFERIRACD